MYTFQIAPRDFTKIEYALYRVRQISGDKVENPPFSLSDEEWKEHLEDTKVGTHYQVFLAVLQAVSTDPTRLQALTEASGSYTFSDLEAVKVSLREQQKALNGTLGLTVAPSKGFRSIPVQVVF